MTNQDKIKDINQEGQKQGYSAGNNENVFYSPSELQQRMGYSKLSSSNKRKRSLNEPTFFPPFFGDEQGTKACNEQTLIRSER